MTFFSPEEILLDVNTLSMSTSPKRLGFYNAEIYAFHFQYYQMLKFLFSFLYVKINFYI